MRKGLIPKVRTESAKKGCNFILYSKLLVICHLIWKLVIKKLEVFKTKFI